MTAISRLARFAPPWLWQSLARAALVNGYADSEKASRSVDVFLRPFSSEGGGELFAQHYDELLGVDFMTGSNPGQITVPSSILIGRDDPFVTVDEARALQQLIPRSTLQVYESQRHFLPEEAPSEVASAVAALIARKS
jgi:pimeloyl-ACP methyl ester carboxylesterase